MEYERIKGLVDREGMPAAIEFAKRTYKNYRVCLFQSRKRGFAKPHHASIPEYRRGFVMSCLSLRKFLREVGK